MVLGSKQTANQCQHIPVTGTSAALGLRLGATDGMSPTEDNCLQLLPELGHIRAAGGHPWGAAISLKPP